MLFVILLDFIFGYCVLSAPDCAQAADFLLRRRLRYRGFRRSGEGAVFSMRRAEYKKYSGELCLIRAGLICEKGLPSLLKRYRKRAGLPVGAALFCFMLFFSSRFIWDMDVSGNSALTDDEITGLLAVHGCRIGAYIPDLDLYSVCCRCMLDDGRIAWMSVNLKGTVAHVEVIESKEKPPEKDTRPSNIVASCDGVINYCNVYSGTCVAEAGQQVRKGDLLVSGISGDESADSSLVRADADIYAYTVHTLSVRVPYVYEELRPAGEARRYLTANIFGKSIKLYLNSGNLPESCDTINNNEISLEKTRYRLVLFKEVELPVIIDETSVRRTEKRTVTLDDEGALGEAKRRLGELASEQLERADVLSRSARAEIYGEGDGKYLVYSVEYRCIEDIAVRSAIGTE